MADRRRGKAGWVYESSHRAALYDLWGNLTESRARDRALSAASMKSDESVLEVGVGTGVLFARLARRPEPRLCVGIELSEGMLGRAHRRLAPTGNRRASLCRADARILPFADATFDLVVICYVLDLLADPDMMKTLEEIRRVLKSSGRLVMLSMTKQSPILNAVWMWLYRHARAAVGGCRPIKAAEQLDARGWRLDTRENLSEHGFRSELIVARRAK